MSIASKLPATTLDARGDRLRFSLANAINECEQEYRNSGTTGKAVSLGALLSAAQAQLTALSNPGALTVSSVAGDNTITAAEAATDLAVAGTATNLNGSSVEVLIDGLVVATVPVSANAYTTGTAIKAATWTALSLGTHTITVRATDAAGFLRSASRTVTRTA